MLFIMGVQTSSGWKKTLNFLLIFRDFLFGFFPGTIFSRFYFFIYLFFFFFWILIRWFFFFVCWILKIFFQYMSGTCLGTHFFALSLQEDLTSFEFYRFYPKLNGSSCDSFPFFQKPKPKIEQVEKQYFPSKAKEHTLFQASISGPKYQL